MKERMKLVPGIVVHRAEQGWILVHPDTAAWAYVDDEGLRALQQCLTNASVEVTDIPPEAQQNLQEAGLACQEENASIEKRPYKQKAVHVDNTIIRITHRCNLTCEYCYAISPGEVGDLSLEYGRLLVDRLMEMPQQTTAIQFHGGEPMAVFDKVKELTEYAVPLACSKGKDLTLVIQTNATLLNAERVEFLKNYNFEVGVSLDGVKATNDAHRCISSGRGSFDQAMRGIRLLRDNGISIGVNCVVTRNGVQDLIKNVEFLSSEVSQHIKLTPAYLRRGHPAYHELVPDYYEFYRAICKLMDYMLQTGLSEKVHLIDLDHLLINCLTSTRPYMCLRMPCGAGVNQIAVDVSGNLFPCDALVGIDAFRLGHITQVDDMYRFLLDNWARRHLAKEFKDVEGCNSCTWREFCGHCIASAYYANGDENKKKVQCDFYRNMIPHLIEKIALEDRIREFRWVEL